MTLVPLSPQPSPVAQWREVHKSTPALVALADRHYTRQTPGSPQCCRPGVNLCLLTDDCSAAWVVWRPIPAVGRKDGLEAWECTLMRNEGRRRTSDLIREAVEWTWRAWGWPPRDGLITAIDAEATAAGRSPHARPGRCFRAAGWREIERRRSRNGGVQVWLRAPHPQRIPAGGDRRVAPMTCGHCGHEYEPPQPPWGPRVESCGLCPWCGWVTLHGTPIKVTVTTAGSGPARPKDGER